MNCDVIRAHIIIHIQVQHMKTSLDTSKIGKTGLKVTKIGIGGAPLGGLDSKTAQDTLEYAYSQGIRYFDTAPLYGSGLSEIHNGKFLSTLPRNDFVLSSKVGRLIIPGQDIPFNYTKEGILRSIDESLTRLKLDSLDIVLIHDPDNHYSSALNEAFPTLAKLREQGVIKAIGAGMNQWEMLRQFAKDAEFDCFLVAGRYTLLDHSALHELMPLCLEKDISLILGGPYNSGILASDLDNKSTYFYDPSPFEVIEKAKKIKQVCDRHRVPLKAAAIQFGLMHRSVVATIPGPRSPEEIKENISMASIKIAPDLWRELKQEKLIHQDCPE
ncbi:MAG: D-threo-aldose 1-dehydrogenase [Chloroflexi bacterium]|nr:MAG: D-threo-aldose 1-dehydrogenase [Chloroflexota bacterium]